MRLTIDEYSKHFKMSQEMINSKLKAKKLNYIIENGITYIIVTRNSVNAQKHEEIHEEIHNDKKLEQVISDTEIIQKPKPTVAMILSLYQRENRQLKEKILELEAKIDKLIDDKEQMLRDERDKIEQVYSAKDEQLKTILELINKKIMLQEQTESLIEAQSSIAHTPPSKIIELREYLKTLDLKSYQRKIIKRRFAAVRDNDIRVIQQNGKMFLDFSKYDYSDLLEY